MNFIRWAGDVVPLSSLAVGTASAADDKGNPLVDQVRAAPLRT